MSKREEYELAHGLAKLIIFLIIMGVCLQEENWKQTCFITTLWFYGINFTARIIETLRRFERKHKWF